MPHWIRDGLSATLPGGLLGIHLTPLVVVKCVASGVLTTLGMYYLGVGKAEHHLGKIIRGAVLVMAGMFVFL